MPIEPITWKDSPQNSEPGRPLTDAVRKAIGDVRQGAMIDDLLFLERWEISPLPGTPSALRISQIRRANPVLAAAVRAELASLR